MLLAIHKACDLRGRRTMWQRLPVVPGIFGRLLIKSQAPTASRKFTAPPMAAPGISDIDTQVIDRFIDVQEKILQAIRNPNTHDLARTIMVSPFIAFITYSVLDGVRLIAAHERRHYEQACRVLQAGSYLPAKNAVM
jgi:hypothetical protein